jgi:hypothetical protein
VRAQAGQVIEGRLGVRRRHREDECQRQADQHTPGEADELSAIV